MNPADVARRLGSGHADAANVSNWLNGRNERNAPTMRNLLRLSAALKTSPEELLTGDPERPTR